jgi:transcriptional regulator with XRE-family HTH domain
MVTRIRKGTKPRVFLREWRKRKELRATAMAERLGIERESYYRLERETDRLNNAEMRELAEAIGIEPDQLWHHPDQPSVNALLTGADQNTKETAVDIVRRLVKKAS